MRCETHAAPAGPTLEKEIELLTRSFETLMALLQTTDEREAEKMIKYVWE